MARLSLSGTVTRDCVWLRILKPPAVCSECGLDGWMDGWMDGNGNDGDECWEMSMCTATFVCLFSLSLSLSLALSFFFL